MRDRKDRRDRGFAKHILLCERLTEAKERQHCAIKDRGDMCDRRIQREKTTGRKGGTARCNDKQKR